MEFQYDNLPVNASLMALSGHLAIDLECLNDANSLLINDEGCFAKCSDHPDREGAYLYFDLIRRVFVRSGKVVGRGFSKRDSKHRVSSKEDEPSSAFYRRWPSKTSSRAANRGIKGKFEHLIPVIAIGFDSGSEELKYLDRDWTKGGLMVVSEKNEKHIRASFKNIRCPDLEKFQHMLAYSFEQGYNLALAPSNDESDNPGYECVLGVYSSS